jgi:hypothetical protein
VFSTTLQKHKLFAMETSRESRAGRQRQGATGAKRTTDLHGTWGELSDPGFLWPRQAMRIVDLPCILSVKNGHLEQDMAYRAKNGII